MSYDTGQWYYITGITTAVRTADVYIIVRNI